MRLGLIARPDSRGLGVQLKAVHDNLQPVKTMVIDCPSAKPLPIRKDWYPYAQWVHGLPCEKDWRRFFTGIDVLYSAETCYSREVYGIAREMGVKIVQHLNFEFLDHQDQPAIWAAPSKWHWSDIPSPKVFLPVPVETDRFEPQTAARASRFLHIVGRPAIHDRAGTADMLLALESVYCDITVTITCQEIGFVDSLIRANNINLPDNIDLRIREGDVTDHVDLYKGQHVMISPRRFGGLSLPMQEACAAGLPVIAPAISPQTDWLPSDWLVPAPMVSQFRAKQLIDLHTVDHIALAAKISQFALNPVFYRQASEQALGIAKRLSWDNLRSEYERILSA